MILGEDRCERYILEVFDAQGCRSIALEAATYSLGRDKTNAIVIHSDSVSRQHALLLRVPRGDGQQGYDYRIVDGNLSGKRSTNGIEVNGKPQLEYVLQTGDRVKFSDHVELRYYVKLMNEGEFRRYADSVSHCHFVTRPIDTSKTYVAEDDADDADSADLALPQAAQVSRPKEDSEPTRPPVPVSTLSTLAEEVPFWQRKSILIAAIVLVVALIGFGSGLTSYINGSDPESPATSGE
jgi:pSer/pThr/pTyr-binding forkhead associated (FHA) protein